MAEEKGNPLLEPIELNKSLTLKNRFMMSPMTRNRGIVPSDLHVRYYEQRASAGLIVTEGIFIEKLGAEWHHAPGIYTKEQIEGWKKVTDAVHAKGGLIFAQLWHVGRVAHHLLNPGNVLPVAPSAIQAAGGKIETPEGTKTYEVPRELVTDEVEQMVQRYKLAAYNAKEAGFDGVELHGAFGYLPNQFLLDGSNKRTDKYGGSFENRSRFILEILDELVKVWTADRVAIKLSPSNTYNGMSDSDPKGIYTYLLEKLNDYKLAYVNLMEGSPADESHGGKLIPCKEFRSVYKGTLFFNSGYTAETGAQALKNADCDGIAFGRSFISNPDFVERVQLSKEITPLTDWSTLYFGGEKGYIDYPTWDQTQPKN
jgi:N-ethylmaleimide reductase